MLRVKVLVMVDWYAPGFRAGGPIRSAVNFADQLEHDRDIYVFTTDRDLGDDRPYSGIETDRWTPRNRHQVFYASPSFLHWGNIYKLLKALQPRHIYLNSMFSRYGTIYPLLMKRLGWIDARMTLAPRGMLKASALDHKATKKKLFLHVFKSLRLSRGVCFQATDETERYDLERIIGPNIELFTAGNLPGKQAVFSKPPRKVSGSLMMIFVGRFHPIKNLDWILQLLQQVDSNVELTIIATAEDREYENICRLKASSLPENIRVTFILDVPHDKIEGLIRMNHIFALPTRGENFGHAIFEALGAGRPVLISDQTPWRRLKDTQSGWDLPLTEADAWRDAIQQAIGWDSATHEIWCRNAWQRAADYLQANDLKNSYLKQFS